MAKIVVLSGSVRREGNTERLVKAFIEGAKQKNQVEIVSVADYKIDPCIGCNACFSNEIGNCVQKDDMVKIYEILMDADILVVASPVYFYQISSQLKALIDRLHTPKRNQFKIKKLVLLLVGAASIPNLFDSIKVQYRLVLDFFHLEDGGMVLVSGVKDKGDIMGNPKLKEAYELGKTITL